MTFSEDDARFLRRAIAVAIEARTRGDDPFGAILVHDGDIVTSNGRFVPGFFDNRNDQQ